MSKDSMRSKTISGMIWSMADLISKQGIQFIIQIALARLLLPEEFGIIGMMTIFIALSQTIANSGFSTALIREAHVEEDDYNTVFFFNMLMALGLYGLLFLSAGAISAYFGEPKLLAVIRVLGLIVIVDAFAMVQRTKLARAIDFKTRTRINVIATFISGGVAVFMAFRGYGVWSLVARNLLQQSVVALLLVGHNRWLPSLTFRVETFKRMFGFSWRLLASSLINTLYKNIYYVIIGRYFSAVELGYYTNGRKLRDTASQSVTTSIQRVTFPVLSQLQGDDVKLKKGTKKIIKNTVFITFPVMAGMAAIAGPMMGVFMGEKWVASVPYFQILSLTGLFFPLHAINLNILQVKGRSDLFLRLEIIKKVITTVAIVLVLTFDMTILELLWVGVLNSVIAYIINSHYSAKLIRYPIGEQVRDILPILLATAAMAGGVLAFVHIMADKMVAALLGGMLLGVLIYIGLCLLFGVKELRQGIDMVRTHLKKP